MLSVLFKLFSSQHIFILTTTGTTITTHRSKTDIDLCHLCNLCELLYTNGLELAMKKYIFIFDNLWKFTGISVKYKTQIGTNGHKLSKILLFKSQATILNSQFSILNSKESSHTPKKLYTPKNFSLHMVLNHLIINSNFLACF